MSDPDVVVSLMALKRLGIQRNEALRDLVKRRMRLASETRDRSALNELAHEDSGGLL